MLQHFVRQSRTIAISIRFDVTGKSRAKVTGVYLIAISESVSPDSRPSNYSPYEAGGRNPLELFLARE